MAPPSFSRPATRFALHALAFAALQATAAAQDAAPPAPAPASAEQITVTGKIDRLPASVAGFGDTPIDRTPLQVLSLSQAVLADQGANALSALTRLDASIADAYNAPGYWSALTIRGYVLDNHYNYLRDGLPINAETAIALENKERVEVLKGISGAQAGTSTPGGMANLVVKRPRGSNQASVSLGWSERGNAKLATDIERWFGPNDAVGLRVNAAVESLDPVIRDSQGERHLLALAGAWRITPDRRLDAEVELSHQSQPSMPGLSMLGSRVPSAREIDPRTNLNNQAWSEPVVFDGTTASLRWVETLSPDWSLTAQAMTQHLRTDDRIAFPYGCSAEGNYDRYCSDGSFDLYDYRSEDERRDSTAAAISLDGRADWAGMKHSLSLGLMRSDFELHANQQTYEWAGVGAIDGSAQVDEPPPGLYDNPGRRERSTELHLRDHIELTRATGLWLGLRHTALDRASGSTGTRYKQSFTTPWLALSHQWTEALMAYASWGQGIESAVVPNLPIYTNAGEALPALRSRQAEIGLKYAQADWNVALTAFDIRRPMTEDLGACDNDATCTRRSDGNARHRGLEASAEARWGAFSLQGSGMWLRARREGASDTTQNGLTPTNVAERSARLVAGWQVADLPGLLIQASASYEGPRYVLPDNSALIPGWTIAGLAARYTTRALGREWTWRAGIDNLFDRRAWREAPYQFDHAYLYPLEPRTFRTSFQMGL